MPFATRNSLKFHLQELGEGPPLVMLHGLLVGSLATWYFTAAPVLARTHHVLLYDLRGHGLSERAPRGYGIDTMREDLEAIVDAFTTRPVTLVGHSYGAVVALSYALAHPARVDRLVLVEAPLPPSRLEELEAFVRRQPEAMMESLPEVLREVLGSRGRKAAKLVSSLRFLASESSLLSDLRHAKDLEDAELARLRCPVLCVYGTRSSCRPVGERLARTLPSAALVEIEAGHFLPLESPAALTRTIAEFVDGKSQDHDG